MDNSIGVQIKSFNSLLTKNIYAKVKSAYVIQDFISVSITLYQTVNFLL